MRFNHEMMQNSQRKVKKKPEKYRKALGKTKNPVGNGFLSCGVMFRIYYTRAGTTKLSQGTLCIYIDVLHCQGSTQLLDSLLLMPEQRPKSNDCQIANSFISCYLRLPEGHGLTSITKISTLAGEDLVFEINRQLSWIQHPNIHWIFFNFTNFCLD